MLGLVLKTANISVAAPTLEVPARYAGATPASLKLDPFGVRRMYIQRIKLSVEEPYKLSINCTEGQGCRSLASCSARGLECYVPPPCHHICTLGWKPPLEVIGQPSCEVELDKLAQIVILYNFGSVCEQPVCAIST